MILNDMASFSTTFKSTASDLQSIIQHATIPNRTNVTTIENPHPNWTELLLVIVKCCIFGIIILSAVLGNALVIISVHRHRKLRVITNYYVVSLAMADMLVALCAMTFNASVELTNGKWLFGYFMCDVYNSLDVYFSTASILHLCCISVDRYYAIVRPLEYPITMTHKTVSFMLTNVWLLPALISFTPIFLGWYTTDDHKEYRISHPDICIFVVNQYYAVISSSISFWIPGIVMVTMYCRIYKEAVRQRKALSRTSSNIILNSIHQHRTSYRDRYSEHYLHPSDGEMTTIGQINGRRSTSSGSAISYGTTLTEINTAMNSRDNSKAATELNVNAPSRESNLEEEDEFLAKHAEARRTAGFVSEDIRPEERNPQFIKAKGDEFMKNKNYLGAISTYSYGIKLSKNFVDFYISRSEAYLAIGTTIRQQSKSWRAEHKAARTLGIIMGAFIFCWLPFFLWYVITTLCGEACNTPDWVIGMLFWVGYFNSALNPLIYAYFNRDFREAFKDTLICAMPCCFTCWKTPARFL